MFKMLAKKIIRKIAWSAKKKTISQILMSRCRRDGMPEYGRFTNKEIKQIILQANSNVNELMPYFHNLDDVGNYQNEYVGLIDLAIYRALLTANIERNYAVTLVGDMQ